MFKKNIIVGLCFIFYVLIPILCNSSINIILKGLTPELEYNVRKKLSDIHINDTYINSDVYKQLHNAIRSGLKPLGYYDPKINIFLYPENAKSKQSRRLIIEINSGEPVKIVEVNLHIFGDGQYDADHQKIVKDSQLFIGKKLNHNDYEQLKNRLYNLAISKGYLDAKFKNSQLIVIPSLYQSVWNIDFYSGKRYLFEEIKFQGSQIKDSYLRKICNISLGEYYHSESIMELNRRLSSTNWFESILTSLDYDVYSQKKN